MTAQPRVAIVHYWLVDVRGGERVVEELCALYPTADIYTNVYHPDSFAGTRIARARVRTTFINSLPFARRLLEPYLVLMPLALEQLDLSTYDLVISSESGPAKGAIVSPNSLHVCYCHSPMRYAWDMYPAYLAEAGLVKRTVMRIAMHYLRQWDFLSAQRPDAIISNSSHTQRRVAQFWRRESSILHPPVRTQAFRCTHDGAVKSHFVCAGQLMSYKRIDLAVDAFNLLGLPLVIVGSGPELRRLRSRAADNIRFVERVPDDEFAMLLSSARALVFPGEEDFGIVPVEAMSAGVPVIAFRRGGVLDTVIEGTTGEYFDQQTPKSLADAVNRFIANEHLFDAERIRRHADSFDQVRFRERFREAVDAARSAKFGPEAREMQPVI